MISVKFLLVAASVVFPFVILAYFMWLDVTEAGNCFRDCRKEVRRKRLMDQLGLLGRSIVTGDSQAALYGRLHSIEERLKGLEKKSK